MPRLPPVMITFLPLNEILIAMLMGLARLQLDE
jgi:hypothetical protein